MKNNHMTQIFDYLETLQGEGKNGLGMTPTNLHYCSNNVNLLGLKCLTISNDLPYEGSSLLKYFETIRSHLVREFHTYKKLRTLLGDLQRYVKTTLLIYLP